MFHTYYSYVDDLREGFVLCITILYLSTLVFINSCCKESSHPEFWNLRQRQFFNVGIIIILQTCRINTRDGFFCNKLYHTGQKPVGGCHCPMAAMVSSPRQHRIQQLANMLRDKSMLLKLENIIVFTMYLLAILRHGASLRCRAWVFVGCAALWEYHSLSRRRWDYNTLSGRRWEYDALSVRWEHDSLSTACCEYDTLRAVWWCHYATVMLTAAWQGRGNKKNNNWQYWQLPINNFGQQHLNGAANRSAANDGQVLPHFQQIVSRASTPPCPIAAVF